MPDDTSTAPTPTESSQGKGCLGCLGVVVFVVLGTWITGGFSRPNEYTVNNPVGSPEWNKRHEELEREKQLKDGAKKKLPALEAIVQKLKSFPDRFASDSEHSKYNGEVRVLVDQFIAIPFDAKANPKVARSIIELFEAKVQKRYSGHVFNLLEAHITEIFQDLRNR
jgi:hypothetical protein